MSKEELKIGEISKPRFEFRSFGQEFDRAAAHMARLSVPLPKKVWERHSDEIYILSRTNDINNAKVRDSKMDIKTYVLINGARLVTINSESTETEDIQKTLSDIGLNGVENINYLQAIKRVIGMIDKPLAN